MYTTCIKLSIKPSNLNTYSYNDHNAIFLYSVHSVPPDTITPRSLPSHFQYLYIEHSRLQALASISNNLFVAVICLSNKPLDQIIGEKTNV